MWISVRVRVTELYGYWVTGSGFFGLGFRFPVYLFGLVGFRVSARFQVRGGVKGRTGQGMLSPCRAGQGVINEQGNARD